MKTLAALGIAGGFLFAPKGTVALAIVWSVAKVSPVLGLGLLALGWLSGGL